jgi:hypothetical protein
MTRREVTEELDAYTAAVASSSSAVIARLRPGIASGELERLEDEFDTVLPDDARAIWEWRDGEDAGYPSTFTGVGRFLPLREAFAAGRAILEPRRSGGHTDPRPGCTWLVLAHEPGPTVVVEVREDGSAVTVRADPAEPVDQSPVVSVAERIRWWRWAVENHAWNLSEDGTWSWDFGRYPPRPEGDLL